MSKVQRETGSPHHRGASALRGGLTWALSHSPYVLPPPQLDADNGKPNFDEENGQDEYDEVAMPV